MMSQLNEENSHKNSSSKYYISSLYTYDLTLKIIWDKNLPVKERQECKKYICKLNLGIFILKLFILEFSKKKTWHIFERIQSSMFGITCILWSKLVRTLSYFWSIEEHSSTLKPPLIFAAAACLVNNKYIFQILMVLWKKIKEYF